MTSKQRSYLKSLANSLDSIFQLGKSSLTPEFVQAVSEAFNTRELLKVTVLKQGVPVPKWFRSLGGKLSYIKKARKTKKLSCHKRRIMNIKRKQKNGLIWQNAQ